MADPVTLAMIGATAGAVTNKKDPLKGALLGATLGYGGGALAPSLLGTGATAASGAAGAAGVTSGLPAATGGLLGSTAPLMSGGASPVASALSAQGIAGAPLMSTMPAAPSMMSRLATPQTLMAAGQLAGSMSPPPQRAQPLPLRPGQPSQVIMPEISIVQSPLLPGQRQLQYPGIMQTQLRPGQSEVLLNYFPVERFQ
jgi:hypothetical protein